jgi:hypothetical protein
MRRHSCKQEKHLHESPDFNGYVTHEKQANPCLVQHCIPEKPCNIITNNITRVGEKRLHGEEA